METIYFDHAATTPVREEVIEKMNPYFRKYFGNPSSVYDISNKTKEAIEDSRERIANILNCSPEEIFFTSGGTESDNWAIIGTAFANKNKGNQIITSSVEHHAVLHTFEYLSKHGFNVTYIPGDEMGFVKLDELKNAITNDTKTNPINANNLFVSFFMFFLLLIYSTKKYQFKNADNKINNAGINRAMILS